MIFLGIAFGYWGFGKLVFYLLTLQFYGTMMETTLTAAMDGTIEAVRCAIGDMVQEGADLVDIKGE